MGEYDLTRRIKDQARALGFDLVGVAPLAPSRYGDFYEAWLARGYAGDMAYLARPDAVAKRRDPRLILPEARSAVVVALNYYQGPLGSRQPGSAASNGLRGRVARYAWGDDYHDLMWYRLDALAAFIEAEVGSPVSHRRYVDTGPLLERELAVRAGLGWFGKNTMLIHPRLGSWLLLGELLLALDLAPDPPCRADHCGTCTRCIDACPTRCILPDRTLDASRCISYLTIELKRDQIPADLRPQLGPWIFGCDLCQEVCPWNRFARPTAAPAFQPRAGLPAPDLHELLALDDQTFRRRFQGSPIQRARRRGLQRNAAAALANQEPARDS
ncbi:MAG: tRNA epoxyqueuosine(34) reductase QueG [Anaerolineae bacterium]|nr:MAG: tRNA epoxyqueuosine(34) reductase QueG [Anaerolineae bacterium]